MADITEKQIYEAFGLGEQVQEPAAPAATAPEAPAEGEQVQEPAEPVQQTDAQTDEGTPTEPTEEAPPEEDQDGDTGDGKQPLTPEQRRANAARRRQQEQRAQQAAIDQAVEAAIRQEQDKQEAFLKDFFSKAGLKNTITGEPITSMEQFNDWSGQYEQARLERELKAGKLTPEGLATAIGKHPAVQQAQQLVARNTAAERTQKEAEAKARIEGEIAEIHKIDASINTLEDLFKAPYGKEFYEMTKRGYSVKDAHYLLTKDTLEAAKLEAARQAGMNSARSKDHLSATGGSRGGGAVSVPKADLAMYRVFNPDATDAEIQEHYNKNLKR